MIAWLQDGRRFPFSAAMEIYCLSSEGMDPGRIPLDCHWPTLRRGQTLAAGARRRPQHRLTLECAPPIPLEKPRAEATTLAGQGRQTKERSRALHRAP